MMNYNRKNPLSIGMGYQPPFQSNTTSNPLAIGMGYQMPLESTLTGSNDPMNTIPQLYLKLVQASHGSIMGVSKELHHHYLML